MRGPTHVTHFRPKVTKKFPNIIFFDFCKKRRKKILIKIFDDQNAHGLFLNFRQKSETTIIFDSRDQTSCKKLGNSNAQSLKKVENLSFRHFKSIIIVFFNFCKKEGNKPSRGVSRLPTVFHANIQFWGPLKSQTRHQNMAKIVFD